MRLAASAAAFVFLAGTAVAQTTLVELRDDVAVAAFGLSVDRVDDLDVYVGDRKVGDVEEVLGNTATNAVALVVDFDDDAGYGDRDDVIVPIQRFHFNGTRLVSDIGPEEVAAFPRWED